MRANFKIGVALLPIVFISFEMLGQSPRPTLPNAPAMQPLLVASAQSTADLSSACELHKEHRPCLLGKKPRRSRWRTIQGFASAQLIARIQHQVVRERRADELPDLSGNVTAAAANDGSRISSGSLAVSRLAEHAGMGVQLSQLITDFGRTPNLVASAKLQEKARLADAEASREDIVLATDQVFYAVIEAQETLKVAAQTVSARQALSDQVSALTSSKLRSDLDLSFAQVNLSQAKLLQLNAQNDLDAAKAAFSAVLGYDRQMNFQLVDDTGPLPPLPPDADALIAEAIQNRPDLQSLKFNEQAAQKFSKAQHEQLLPTISALGVVGATPVGSPAIFHDELVWLRGRQCKHPNLQWIPPDGRSLCSFSSGANGLGADPCSSRPGCA